MPIVSGFRNAGEKLRFADGVSATIGTTRSAVSVSRGGDDQSVEEQQSCCSDE